MGIVKSEAIELGTATIPMSAMATGTPDGTKFIRDDGTLAVPPGGGGGGGDVTADDTTTTVQNIVAYSTTGGKNITELTGTQGDVLYHNGTSWAKLPAGTSGQVLKTNGAAANPSWASIVGGDVVGPASATDNAIVRYDGTTGKLVENSGITIDDSGNLAGAGWERSARVIIEERPSVPSTYDDEFDATSMDAKWTFFAGSSSNLTFSRSRILSNGTVHVTQSVSGLTHPLRVRGAFRGNGNAIAQGCNVIIQGVTKWVYFGIDVPGASQRRAVAKRYSNTGVYEADLFASTYATGINSGTMAPMVMVINLVIDSTNINFYMGPLGSEAFIVSVARSVVGSLDKIAIQIVANWSCDWFRVDRATGPYNFPLDWAG